MQSTYALSTCSVLVIWLLFINYKLLLSVLYLIIFNPPDITWLLKAMLWLIIVIWRVVSLVCPRDQSHGKSQCLKTVSVSKRVTCFFYVPLATKSPPFPYETLNLLLFLHTSLYWPCLTLICNRAPSFPYSEFPQTSPWAPGKHALHTEADAHSAKCAGEQVSSSPTKKPVVRGDNTAGLSWTHCCTKRWVDNNNCYVLWQSINYYNSPLNNRNKKIPSLQGSVVPSFLIEAFYATRRVAILRLAPS